MDTKTKISLFVIASLIITIATITGPSVFAKLTTSSTTTDVSMHITEAIKALRSGDIQGAKMHLAEAIKALRSLDNTTDVSMHITEAIKALRSGDIQGAKMHLAEAITSLQSGDISKIPLQTQILH
jgi:cellobiose-specific phosphotransferase system component IIA